MDAVWKIVDQSIREGLIRGAVVLFGTPDEISFAGAYGLADHLTGRVMTPESVFDMASVTKAVGIGTLLARTMERGQVDMAAPFHAYLPGFRGKLECPVTVRDLATHYSGLDPERTYDRAMAFGPERLMDAMLDLRGVTPPGTGYLYCCANYILLGMILEVVNGEGLEVQAEREIFVPAGMARSSWGMPKKEVRCDMVHPRLATTHGRTPEELVPPEIGALDCSDDLPSDETARWALPRRIGNAGIFSCASDLAGFARFLLKRPFTDRGWRELASNHAPEGMHPRSSGWDMEPTGVFSPPALHHTGWSGQSLWIDPEEQVFGMVLTNRCDDHGAGKARRLEIIRAAREECGR